MSDRHPRPARRRRTDPAAPRSRPEPDTGPEGAPEDKASVVQATLYRGGRQVSSPDTLAETFRQLREAPDGMAWIGLHRPSETELHSLAAEFDLHELAVEDAMEAHQRPKLERYGDTLFVVLRAARYLDAPEEVDFGELHVFVGRDFVITVRHADAPDLSAVRHRMEENPELLALGPEAVLYAILDAVVDGYAPVVEGCRTTSTRSRPRSSAETRRSPVAPTNSPARWSSSSAPPAPWSACCTV